MTNVKKIGGSIAAAVLLVSIASSGTVAGPTGLSLAGFSTAHNLTEQIRVRRPAKRQSSAVPGAVIGLFGAILGGAIANQRYDNYSTYSYGQPYDYGYSPGYSPGYASGPVYRGRGGAAFGGVRSHGGGNRGSAGAGRTPGHRR